MPLAPLFTAREGDNPLPPGYPYGIKETRRDGGTMTFAYMNVRDARADLPALRVAHVGRTYEAIGFEDLQAPQ